MSVTSVGSILAFDPSQFINRLAAGAGQSRQSSSPTASDMATGMAKTVLDTADSDGNGVLTIEESGQSEEVFSRFDTDDDGFLSEEELIVGMTDDITALQAMFETDTDLDTDSLFNVGAAGVAVPPPPPGGGAMDTTQMATDLTDSILSSADADGDGYLTIEESGQNEEVFNRFDTDSDGLLSQEELVTGLQEDMETLQATFAEETTDTSSLFDLSAAGLGSTESSGTEESSAAASASASSSASGASGSSSSSTETDTVTTVSETPTATITTTTTTTTTTAADGTVTTETSTASKSIPKMSDLTTMLYQALANTAAVYNSNTLDIQG